MKPFAFLFFLMAAATLDAAPSGVQEPDLQGRWHRENGAVLEASRTASGWSLTLVQVAPSAKNAQDAVGTVLVTGLKWSGQFWRGTLRLPGKQSQSFECRVVPLDDHRMELEVFAFPLSKKEVLTRG